MTLSASGGTGPSQVARKPRERVRVARLVVRCTVCAGKEAMLLQRSARLDDELHVGVAGLAPPRHLEVHLVVPVLVDLVPVLYVPREYAEDKILGQLTGDYRAIRLEHFD
eukprot:CAMPEP_0113525732 /NCGR_PEP_ID=MMETSP0015_2-20120614/332_1 /TAXON_ID=2838 /ORGANISM="Odontella" /LENGTH=109 /DNA_ID=CAMNT_0000423945 /DNA_START=349 /DNA_END=678 /DNA_ORIENTATION=- /assembly_acc=CAM_ASM_000160